MIMRYCKIDKTFCSLVYVMFKSIMGPDKTVSLFRFRKERKKERRGGGGSLHRPLPVVTYMTQPVAVRDHGLHVTPLRKEREGIVCKTYGGMIAPIREGWTERFCEAEG